jgi:peptidoglycan/LPS O-acetylase OafA/YrhL
VDRSEGQRVIFYFAWSLAVQEQFYLFWPVILRVVRRRYAFFLPLAFLLAGDASAWLTRGFGLEGALSTRILASLDSPILLGVLAAFLLETRRTFPLLHRVAGQRWSVPVAILLVLLPRWIPRLPQDVFAVAITYLVISCVLAPAAAAQVVDNRLARHIGNVSYGIYLFHMLVLNGVRHVLPSQGPAVLFAVGFPIVVLIATASHRWFEEPFIRLRERLVEPWRGLERNAAVPLVTSPPGAGR